jgi:hypothetical protein
MWERTERKQLKKQIYQHQLIKPEDMLRLEQDKYTIVYDRLYQSNDSALNKN